MAEGEGRSWRKFAHWHSNPQSVFDKKEKFVALIPDLQFVVVQITGSFGFFDLNHFHFPLTWLRLEDLFRKYGNVIRVEMPTDMNGESRGKIW